MRRADNQNKPEKVQPYRNNKKQCVFFFSFLEKEKTNTSTINQSIVPGRVPSHRTPSFIYFSNMAPSYELQFFLICSSMYLFHRVQSFRKRPLLHGIPRKSLPSKAAPAWCPLSIDLQVLPGACSNTGCSLGHGPLWASICTSVGFSRVCRWISAPLWTSMGYRSTGTLTTVFTTSFRETCSNTWITSSPSFPTDPVSAELLLSHVLILSSLAATASVL